MQTGWSLYCQNNSMKLLLLHFLCCSNVRAKWVTKFKETPISLFLKNSDIVTISKQTSEHLLVADIRTLSLFGKGALPLKLLEANFFILTRYFWKPPLFIYRELRYTFAVANNLILGLNIIHVGLK